MEDFRSTELWRYIMMRAKLDVLLHGCNKEKLVSADAVMIVINDVAPQVECVTEIFPTSVPCMHLITIPVPPRVTINCGNGKFYVRCFPTIGICTIECLDYASTNICNKVAAEARKELQAAYFTQPYFIQPVVNENFEYMCGLNENGSALMDMPAFDHLEVGVPISDNFIDKLLSLRHLLYFERWIDAVRLTYYHSSVQRNGSNLEALLKTVKIGEIQSLESVSKVFGIHKSENKSKKRDRFVSVVRAQFKYAQEYEDHLPDAVGLFYHMFLPAEQQYRSGRQESDMLTDYINAVRLSYYGDMVTIRHTKLATVWNSNMLGPAEKRLGGTLDGFIAEIRSKYPTAQNFEDSMPDVVTLYGNSYLPSSHVHKSKRSLVDKLYDWINCTRREWYKTMVKVSKLKIASVFASICGQTKSCNDVENPSRKRTKINNSAVDMSVSTHCEDQSLTDITSTSSDSGSTCFDGDFDFDFDLTDWWMNDSADVQPGTLDLADSDSANITAEDWDRIIVELGTFDGDDEV
jgi:hypothetical protein